MFHRKDDLEGRLRAARSTPRAEFVSSLSESIDRRRRTRRSQSWRVVFVGGLSAAMLILLASVGGLSYAASAVQHAVVPTKKATPVTAASAQYGGKTTICHKGHTITVSNNALPAHLRHHDTVGPCPTSGVKGAQATRTSGGPSGGVLGATAGNDPLSASAGGNLPFTGASLGLALAVGLFLLTTGIALRMRARRN